VIVVDASIVIAWFGATDPHHESAEKFLLEHAQSDLVIHPVTFAEILVGPTRLARVEDARTALSRVGVRTDLPDADQPLRLAELRAETGLKLPDCCVLDITLVHRVPIATFDDRLAAAAAAKDLQVLPRR
jgi:predicted nucleic acid-binding protein